MGLTLTIDQGNSSAKVAVWDGNNLVYFMPFVSLDDDELTSLAARYDIDRAMYCTVAEQQDMLPQILEEHGIRATEFTHGTPIPLIIDYATPSTLGVDRVAAAVAASRLHPGTELLIVDAGTAITYDRVTARNHFVGGNISPGIGMRLKSLHAYTARLPLVSSRGETRLWGNTTESALRSGAFNGVIAEISYYHSRLPHDAVVMISGGWGQELAAKLDFKTDYQECLVNRGLNDLLMYNEDN